MGKKTNVMTHRTVFGEVQFREAEKVNGFTFLHGRAVPYNTPANLGWYLERHMPGSFAKSIEEAAIDLPLLMFHDSRQFPIGAADSWDDNNEGLDGIWRLDPDSEYAQRAASLADKRMLSGMSIGFSPIRDHWDEVEVWDPDKGPEYMDTKVRTESRLLEVSLVSTPAFKEARVELVRSAEVNPRRKEAGTRELESWRRELEALRG